MEPVTLPSVAPLAALSDDACAALRARFAAAGYVDAVLAAADAVAPGALDHVRAPLVLLALARRGDAAGDLARLLAFGDALDVAAARAALGDASFDALAAAGVLAVADGAVRARFRVVPFEGLWVLSDELSAGGDEVMGAARLTSRLALMIPDPAPASVLDLGCGAGALALVAAKRGAAVAVGADVNPRAIAMARFNARLNGLAAEFVAGDADAPVRGRRFDLIVSQPPFIVQPDAASAVTYMHGGPRGDAVALRFAGAAPGLLAPGGRALLVFDTAVEPGRPLHARLQAVLGDGAPVDLLVLAAPGMPPDLQAIQYAVLGHPDLGAGYHEAARRYRAHVEAQGIAEFTLALVALRASGVAGGRFTVTLPVPSLSACDAAALDGVFAALDLACASDAALLAARVRAHPHAKWVEERPGPDPDAAPSRSVRFPPGSLATDRELSEAGVALFHALDAARSVREGAARYAALCGAPEAAVRGQVLGFVRDGLARGLLVPG